MNDELIVQWDYRDPKYIKFAVLSKLLPPVPERVFHLLMCALWWIMPRETIHDLGIYAKPSN